MNKKVKAALFFTLLIPMISYIMWVFYVSEPKYVDNCYKKVEAFDYLSLPPYDFESDYNTANNTVENGLVLQIDSSKAIVKIDNFTTTYKEVDLKKHKFRIIGKGTVYHKVNSYVGTNIMLISQVFIAIICAMICYSLVTLLKDLLD